MEKLSGTVEGIIYRNDENGYSVFVLSGEKFQETVTGTFPVLREGDFVTLKGEFVEHELYGEQFAAKEYEITQPETEEDIENYLASGIIRGIGPKTARDIVDEFGARALDIIETDPMQLLKVRGIGMAKIDIIKESYQEIRAAQNSIMFLQKFGISTNLARKIFACYGEATQVFVSANPYALVKDIDGVGFLSADEIAKKLGFENDCEARINEGIKYCLLEAGNSEGHTYLPKNVLINRACELLQLDDKKIEERLFALVASRSIIFENDEVYHTLFYFAEEVVAKKLLQITASQTESEAQINAEIEKYEKINKIQLAPNQKKAVIESINNGVCIITGGPGTGKTTTLDCILSLLRKRGEKIALAAPTGKAAKRMSQACGEEAKTIHRLLEYSKTDEQTFKFKRNEENPLSCDVCIVDEASMIDIFLMRALLEGISKNARFIFIGDADQLPSVGAGNVLSDMIASEVFPVVRLTEIFRQAAQSMIITNAHKINNGKMPVVNVKDGDFYLDRRVSENEIAQTTVDLCARRLKDKYGLDAFKEIQVLTPIKRGVCGVFSLNKALQKVLNPPSDKRREYVFGEDVFREGDKVIQIRNNYDREWTRYDRFGLATAGDGVFNGDSGIIEEIDKNAHELVVCFDDNKKSVYSFSELDELNLAYALSVHKSQGCEFKFVVMPMPMGNIRILTRNLFYTCVTRAQKMVVLCGSESTIKYMVENNQTQKRYSSLAKRLKSSIKTL